MLLAVAAMFAPCAARAVEIIGHRGASHDAPENTLAAFRLAWEQGADAAEVDIWLSKDQRIVALHITTIINLK
ncbi:MAG: glycerophosphodiester phosphodiesterase family protein, partial [Planctomycetota bacterium]|nr:glycerophosphodiester phosphodiesterase family protein [Planctomycetota bacterium]